MTVFYARRIAAYRELSGDTSNELITGISGQKPLAIMVSNNTREQYPLDQTVSVTNMR